MTRNKALKRKSNTAQRIVTKKNPYTFKSKGITTRSHNLANNKNKKSGGSPGRMRTQTRIESQENQQQSSNAVLNKHRQGRFTRQLRSSMKSDSTNVNNNQLYLTSTSITGQKKQSNINWKSTNETILIEDSDDESKTTDNGKNSRPLFYLDRNPGIRDAEVPLYNVCGEIEESVTNNNTRCPVDNYDDSVIVLDNTINQTMNSNVQMNVETVEPSSSDTVSSSSLNIIADVQIDALSKQSAAPVTNVSTEVIELSDHSDTEPSSSCTSKTTTPAFPTMDCIPLGYSELKRPARKTVANQNALKKRRWDNADNDAVVATKAVPVPKPQNHAEEVEGTKRMVIIDGNNVAYGHLNNKTFSVKGLQLCINYFKRLGHEVTAVVPQFRLKKHQSTDYVLLDKMHRAGDVTLAPSKNLPGQYSSTYDDRLILSVAEQFDGVIISNDNFRDLLEISPAWRRIIETRVIGYTWVKDCFFLPDDPYGRYGPTLQQILNGKSK
ncbi:NEDD4-binding protein 1 [Anopheles moucheti]|uniref:NEDD4-binding protein 1 n=1 Tax=Anopheles moucheti TaxID=186751 RepID=UPI0022F00BC0|nr:NEDD4-binding protein 1 [Anopheles moucheti]XP_052898355.1 NEDD4-binding protein 1 [Anopheles moucheti]XP_052898356.1 NEDD4-binding protein 1 [Anopheles moucheti]